MSDIKIASFARVGGAPFFIFCDHASNAMPGAMNGLGMPDDLLATHVAWDIGAGALAAALAAKLDGALFACGFSRLVIDPNRALDSNDLIPATSDQIPIPGNQMLACAARQDRIERFHIPYHDRLSSALDDFTAAHTHPLIISVHSFTNRLMGAADDRPWKVGLLWREDEYSAKGMMRHLERATGWPIGDNEPYDARVFNYSIDRHVSPRGLAHLTIEVRQDIIGVERDIVRLASILADGVHAITKSRTAMMKGDAP